MGKKSRTSVLKRMREVKKAERAAAKRERRAEREGGNEPRVATADDLAGYGLGPEDEETEPQEEREER